MILATMKDTRSDWRAQIHALARQTGVITYEEVKEAFPELRDANNRKSAWSAVKTFLDSRWFKRTDTGRYYPKGVWHESRFYDKVNKRRRKDDIEYTICSLLQNKGSLTTDGIMEHIKLRSNREPHATHITRLCMNSAFIRLIDRRWEFNYEAAGFKEGC